MSGRRRRAEQLSRSPTARVATSGAAVVGVAFGMARYVYGLTLPDVRTAFGLGEAVLGLVASATFAGYLVGLLAAPRLAARRGPRAPTTVGGACAVLGCLAVALAPSPGVLAAGAVVAGSAAGFVWAPYSDVVARVVQPRHRPTALALITTGTSAGLLALAGLAVVTGAAAWRTTWAGVAVAAAVAAAVNLRGVPRLPPLGGPIPARARRARPRPSALLRAALLGPGAVPRRLRRPLAYAVAYFAATTVCFTYAGDVARSGGLGAAAAPAVFALVGVGGLVGLGTGGMARVAGPRVVAAASLGVVGASVALLALGRGSLAAVLAAALVFGAAYMVGSAVLAVWTAEVAPDRPAEAFTAALVAGALGSVVAPVAVGAAVPVLTLPVVLLVVAVLAVAGAVLVGRRPRGAAV
ncbi:MFS transporter [uncultured Pseudokineococcus sp.]|uniref:MFS transporter n=1 Tax=uncultured Pseudokineococcus sp. TaxID=1642928 RepID=UPI0026206825|nr:MFS transporter [uncultured Pseudokineococcus sp.]